ncbi:Nn.00g092800.m01.CDS01 [Neocucurbitaria sp. VM-36]
MAVTPEDLEAFAPLQWAKSYLNSPNWVVRHRNRGSLPGDDVDRFCRDTMRAHNGIQRWLELYEQPAPGTKLTTSITLCQFGPGFYGYPGIAHGGALLALMDDALSYIHVINDTIFKPPQEAFKGRLVTAKLDVKFLKPVLCPGVMGIEVEMLEDKGHKMKIRGIMKDEKGTPLLQADGL